MRSLCAPCTHNYILLYTSAHPAPVFQCGVSLLCHLNEPPRLLLFYLRVCRSLREVGGRLSPALPVKVSERQMKLCRSDECQRLTANSHQSSCGRGGGERLVAWGPVGFLRILHCLPGLMAQYVQIWSCSLTCNSLVTPVYTAGERGKTAKQSSTTQCCNVFI